VVEGLVRGGPGPVRVEVAPVDAAAEEEAAPLRVVVAGDRQELGLIETGGRDRRPDRKNAGRRHDRASSAGWRGVHRSGHGNTRVPTPSGAPPTRPSAGSARATDPRRGNPGPPSPPRVMSPAGCARACRST